MAYLTLGSTNITYRKSQYIYNFILSEIVDSQCSFEKPVLINSVSELKLYFGDSFSDYEYFHELLSNGVSLYLHKPINYHNNISSKEFNIDDYSEFLNYDSEGNLIGGDGSFDTPEDLPNIKYFPEITELDENGELKNKYKFLVKSEQTSLTEPCYYIYDIELGDYINSSLKILSKEKTDYSNVNRDALRLNVGDSNKIFEYCYPKYSSLSYTPEYTENPGEEFLKSILKSRIDNDKDDIENEYISIAYDIDFSEVQRFKDKDFIVLGKEETSSSIGSELLIYIDYSENGTAPINDNQVQYISNNTEKIRAYDSVRKIEKRRADIIKEILEILKKYNYKLIKKSEELYTIYTNIYTKNNSFFNVTGLRITPNIRVSNNLLSVISDSYKKIEFYSRTIGKNDKDIKIKIEKITSEKYRIIVSRYTYEEIYESYLEPTYNDSTGVFESIEKVINNNSSLIRVKIFNKQFKELPTGVWYLKGSEKETYTAESYQNSLDILKETNIKEDFLLVPDIYKFITNGVSNNINYFEEYKKLFLDYAETKNCQVLFVNKYFDFGCSKIEKCELLPEFKDKQIIYNIVTTVRDKLINYYHLFDSYNNRWINISSTSGRWSELKEMITESGEIIPKNNYIFNYIEEPNYNRLIYFYNDIIYNGYTFPGYYLFIKGLILGTFYETSNNIIYEFPEELNPENTSELLDNYNEISRNAYEDNYVDSLLKEKKSNFLVCNGHQFYYKRFFSTTKDEKQQTSIFTRFAMDKVTNTLEVKLPTIIGLTDISSSEIVNYIESIFTSLKRSYPIIYKLELESIEKNDIKQTILVTLNLYTTDLIDKNIKLNIILNITK